MRERVVSGGLFIKDQDATREGFGDHSLKALLQVEPPPALGQDLQAIADLSDGDRRQEQRCRFLVVQPGHDRRVWRRLHHFCHDVRVDDDHADRRELLEIQRFVRFAWGQLKVYALGGAEHLQEQIAQPLRRRDGPLQDLARTSSSMDTPFRVARSRSLP